MSGFIYIFRHFPIKITKESIDRARDLNYFPCSVFVFLHRYFQNIYNLILTNTPRACKILIGIFHGSAMVSTGDLKYDKRSAPDNRVKMSKLK